MSTLVLGCAQVALQLCSDSTTAKYRVLGGCTQSFSGVCQTAKADCRVLSTTGMPKGDTRGSEAEAEAGEEEREEGGDRGTSITNRRNIRKI